MSTLSAQARAFIVIMAMLEYCIREDLKLKKARIMAAVDPVKVVIDNYPQGQTEQLKTVNYKSHTYFNPILYTYYISISFTGILLYHNQFLKSTSFHYNDRQESRQKEINMLQLISPTQTL